MSNIIIYQTEDGRTSIQTRLEGETVWLTQAQLCDLFQKSKFTISEYIKHIFEEGELEQNSVVRNFRTTAEDGKGYETNANNLPPQEGNIPAFAKDNILVGNIRPYLKKIWFADRSGGCSADVLTFEVNKKVHAKYVYYAMFRDDFFEHMMRGVKGTKMPRGIKKPNFRFFNS